MLYLTKDRPRAFQASVSALRLYDCAASANCYKVRLLLAQLGRHHQRIPVDIFAGDTLTDDYAAMNPLRKTPVLETEHGSSPSRTRSSCTWRRARASCRALPSSAHRCCAG